MRAREHAVVPRGTRRTPARSRRRATYPDFATCRAPRTPSSIDRSELGIGLRSGRSQSHATLKTQPARFAPSSDCDSIRSYEWGSVKGDTMSADNPKSPSEPGDRVGDDDASFEPHEPKTVRFTPDL